LRQRPIRNASLGSGQSLPTSPAASPGESTANTSGVDAVTAGGTNRGSSGPSTTSVSPERSPARNNGKGKIPANDTRKSAELQDRRPKIISPELRELLSRKVEILERKVVRKGGEGLSSLKK
jgi:hypothetical protein